MLFYKLCQALIRFVPSTISCLSGIFALTKMQFFVSGSKFSGFASRQNAVFAESDEEPEEARKK